MGELFLVPAADAAARRNFERTVMAPVSAGQLRGLSKESRRLASHAPLGLAAWGTKAGSKVSTWEMMTPGDWVLFYFEGRFPVAGRVLLREHSPTAARRLWGSDVDGMTWEYLYLMD
jgi:hypothetical protein